MTTPLTQTLPRPFGRLWPVGIALAAIVWGALLGCWGVLRSPGGGAPPDPSVSATWWRVAQVALVMAVMCWLGLLAWRRHGPAPGSDRPPMENGLVLFGVPFGAVMGLNQAFRHVGSFSLDVLGQEAFWWGLASGLTISLPIALWAGAAFGRFIKRRS